MTPFSIAFYPPQVCCFSFYIADLQLFSTDPIFCIFMSSHCYLAEIHFGCPALAWEEKGWSHPVRTKSSVVSGRKVRSVSRKVEKGGKQEPFKSGPIKPEAGLKLRSVSKDTDLYLSWCMYGSSTATNICAHPHCISSPSPCFRRVFCACF